MTRKRTITAALATTASVALLAGLSPAQAQMAGAPGGPCTSTLESPAFNNCTLPSSSAPGAGSFPGSFLVPGTSTSFALHGVMYFNIEHDFSPSNYEGALAPVSALQGPGVSATNLGAHALNGNTDLAVGPTRPNIETRTPTAYGELKTYIEMDFAEVGANGGGASGPIVPGSLANQAAGNENSMRLRQAYGTLGPWLMGQTKTLVDDVQVYPDLADAGLDAGMRTSTVVHKPQIRYTWLAGNGITIAASAEEPTKNAIAYQTAANGALTTATADNNGNTSGGGIVSIPDMGVAGEWDQPWGHVRLSGMYHDSKIENFGLPQANPQTPGQNGFRSEKAGYFFNLTGHINTWGKDRLGLGVAYDNGFADAQGANFPVDRVIGIGFNETLSAWSGLANYEHFFTPQWRANLSGGLIKFQESQLPTNNTTAAAGLPFIQWTTHANVIFSPVPQTDFITEYEHATSHYYSGARGRTDRVVEQFKFYF